MSAPETYPSLIKKLNPEEGGYCVVSFPDFPGCIGVGDTVEAAQLDAQQALAACLDALKAIDRLPPKPSAPAA